MESSVLLETNIPGKDFFARGKVRDTWLIPGWPRTDDEEVLLMITTDRISAFDYIVGGIPDIGKIRNQISLFWFNKLRTICPNHIFSDDQQFCASTVKKGYREQNDLIGRSVLVHKVNIFPVECVVRGFVSGSAWEVCRKGGKICGIKLPPGLKESEELPRPIFTPTTKSKTGHDKPITFDQLAIKVGGGTAEKLRDLSLRLYIKAKQKADILGVIIADTKFEFGVYNGEIVLADEALTPDSSRLWAKEEYRPGKSQSSFDKQPLRDWLNSTGWNKKPPAPELTKAVIKDTRERYIEACQRLVGKYWSQPSLV